MAIGRMLNKSIALDKELNKVSVEAHLLFVMTIPHLDRDGLIAGETLSHLGTVLPFRPDFFHRYEDLMQELIDAGIVLRYDTRNGLVLFFPGFRKNQTFTYSREGPSIFDPPPGYVRTSAGLQLQSDGVTQEELMSSSGVSLEQNTLKLSEYKVSEVNADSGVTYPPGFDEFERMFVANLVTAVKERDPRQSMAGGFSLSDKSRALLLQIMAGGPGLTANAIGWALDQWEDAKPNQAFRAQDTGCVNWLLTTINNSYKPGKPRANSGEVKSKPPAPDLTASARQTARYDELIKQGLPSYEARQQVAHEFATH